VDEPRRSAAPSSRDVPQSDPFQTGALLGAAFVHGVLAAPGDLDPAFGVGGTAIAYAERALDMSRELEEPGHEANALHVLAEIASDPGALVLELAGRRDQALDLAMRSGCARSSPIATLAWAHFTGAQTSVSWRMSTSLQRRRCHLQLQLPSTQRP
jgi:hypothetical protein